MSVSVYYCDHCGVRIEPRDIEMNKAIIDGEKAYCPSCAIKVRPTIEKPVEEKPAEEKAAEEKAAGKKRARPGRQTRAHRPAARGQRAVRRGVPATARRARSDRRADRREEEDRVPGGPPARKKSALPIILGVCGVIVVTIIIALAASGGRKPPKNRRPQDPVGTQPPDERPPGRDRDFEPAPPVQRTPSISPAERKFEEATQYANDYPENYDKIVERLDEILENQDVGPALIEKVQNSLTIWRGRWETAADEEWEKKLEQSRDLTSSGRYEDAAKLFDNFPENLGKFGNYNEMCRNEKRALAILEEIKDDLVRAQGDFTASEVEEAEELFKKILRFGKKHEDFELFVTKLNSILKPLWAKVEALKGEEYEE